MAANPQDDFVNVVIDGVAVKAKKGAMIIHATDQNGRYVPRFCYHDKLPIAANCRMCLVEVEKAPKPLPACATPVAEGMKIFTRSPNALAAQKATMEFLLINHPLDCPICDQGGECELQDLAMGFGRDVARYTESKRVVKDKNIGPLISTDMTRCIHCTRCVRFGQDIAGIQELGTIGRGEHTEIGTFVERSVDHELSGNIIDLCPVGALNSKPFRFHARAWEMTQQPLVSPHDGTGTNLYAHVLRGKVMRVVPRPNEAINETWIADRDRFSYEGIYSPDRLAAPMLRENGAWKTVDWDVALNAAAEALKASADSLGVLASPSATTEELYLLARLARGLGGTDIDHRLRMSDFRDAALDPVAPGLGLPVADIELLSALLVVGCNLRSEAPLLAHRVRKAARCGTKVSFLNPFDYDYLFPVTTRVVSPSTTLPADLLGVLVAAAEAAGTVLPAPFARAAAAVVVGPAHRDLANALASGERRAIWLGALALRHPAWADLRAVATELARITGAVLGVLAEGGNAAGAWLAGAVPHRESGGRPAVRAGRDVQAMFVQPRRAYLLFGGIEPAADFGDAAAVERARAALGQAERVVAITPYVTDELRALAHVLLPMGSFAETSGTYVSLDGTWQSVPGAAQPVGESRPGWKILRVLGNLTGQIDFEYQSSEDVLAELRARCAATAAQPLEPASGSARHIELPRTEVAVPDVPIYCVDALVRRAPALQATRAGLEPEKTL
ncbi:MAG: NADH-quinone oxidoreductase subunit NuoG [Steroidobacteraceae bacterium]